MVVLVVPLISLFEPCRRRLIHSVTSLIDWILRSKRQHDEWRFNAVPPKKKFLCFLFFFAGFAGVQKTGRPAQPNQGMAVTSLEELEEVGAFIESTEGPILIELKLDPSEIPRMRL